MPQEHVANNARVSSALRLPHPRLAESSFIAGEHGICVLSDDCLHEACGTRVAFTLRHGGVSEAPFSSLNLSYAVGDDSSRVRANRHMLLEAMGAGGLEDRLVSPHQVHGCDVLEVDDIARTKELAARGADGIVCTKSDIPVLLCFADCVPVILVAPSGSFAVLHAGWRGALGGIPGIGLEALANLAACDSGDVNCYIGPHIGACCYEFDKDTLGQFVAKYGSGCDAGERHLDLTRAVAASLLKAHAKADRIACADACTSCHVDSFFSHRAEHGTTGRHGAFAMRKEAS